MPKKKDLTNMVFNRLKVIGDSGKREASGSILWTCICDCGEQTLATGTALKSGHKKSCGCLAKEKIIEVGKNNLIDLTNQTFEKLTVIKRVSTSKTPAGATKIFWLCKC